LRNKVGLHTFITIGLVLWKIFEKFFGVFFMGHSVVIVRSSKEDNADNNAVSYSHALHL